jgi:predicted nucleic acid-binding protein
VSRLVLDNTVTMAWCFVEELTEFSEALLGRPSDLTDRALVPSLILYEAVNVIGLAVRKGRIPAEKAQVFLEGLADLPIEIEHLSVPQMFTAVRMLMGQYGLTAYDASYLELAIRYNLTIATFDKALAKAAQAAGVRLLQS